MQRPLLLPLCSVALLLGGLLPLFHGPGAIPTEPLLSILAFLGGFEGLFWLSAWSPWGSSSSSANPLVARNNALRAHSPDWWARTAVRLWGSASAATVALVAIFWIGAMLLQSIGRSHSPLFYLANGLLFAVVEALLRMLSFLALGLFSLPALAFYFRKGDGRHLIPTIVGSLAALVAFFTFLYALLAGLNGGFPVGQYLALLLFLAVQPGRIVQGIMLPATILALRYRRLPQ